MDDDIFSRLLHRVDDKFTSSNNDDIQSNMSLSKKVSPTSFYGHDNGNNDFVESTADNNNLEINNQKIHELESQLNLKIEENRELNKIKSDNETLVDEIKNLNKKIKDLEENNNAANNYDSIYEKNDFLEELQTSLYEYRNKYSIMEINYKKCSEELSQSKDEIGKYIISVSMECFMFFF